jgi:ABC-type oligopeptide transport system substrate-binding subunit
VGRDNFAELHFDYYRDWTVGFEAFKTDQFDWHDEHSAKNWATGYDFPAAADKRVILEEFRPATSCAITGAHGPRRVLLWNHYVVPQLTYGKVRTARWDRFGKLDRMPIYGLSTFPTIWWWDAQRAIETASRS